jgi:hypothetical protein
MNYQTINKNRGFVRNGKEAKNRNIKKSKEDILNNQKDAKRQDTKGVLIMTQNLI